MRSFRSLTHIGAVKSKLPLAGVISCLFANFAFTTSFTIFETIGPIYNAEYLLLLHFLPHLPLYSLLLCLHPSPSPLLFLSLPLQFYSSASSTPQFSPNDVFFIATPISSSM